MATYFFDFSCSISSVKPPAGLAGGGIILGACGGAIMPGGALNPNVLAIFLMQKNC